MSTPISKRRRTGGGKERAYISAILKNRARNNLSRAFMRGFVPSNGILALIKLQKVFQVLIIEDNEVFSRLTMPQVCSMSRKVHLSKRNLRNKEVHVFDDVVVPRLPCLFGHYRPRQAVCALRLHCIGVEAQGARQTSDESGCLFEI